MAAVRLTAILGQDRKLTIELPPEIPPGLVEVEVSSLTEKAVTELTREEVKEQLRRAGILAEPDADVSGIVPLSAEELLELGRPLIPTKPAHEQIIEDRGSK
jgi:hypothetical protein